MKGDSFGKVEYLSKLGMMTSQIRQKIFKVYTAKGIPDAVEKHLKMLSESEQMKQNEDSAKEAVKLVKPITANDKLSFNKPANCKEEYNRKIRQTSWAWKPARARFWCSPMLPEMTNALDLSTTPGIKIRRCKQNYLTTSQRQICDAKSIWYVRIVR